MNTEVLKYIQNFMDRIGIPVEAKNELFTVERIILSNNKLWEIFSKNKSMVMNEEIAFEEALDEVSGLSSLIDISEYTLLLVFLINCTDILHEKYKKEHIAEQIYWDTMCDLRYKMLECHKVKGVWGISTAPWFAGFFKMKRFALGRFQYEEAVFEYNTYRKNGIILNKGDMVYSFHIPSSGERFDKSARIESYRMAYDFYNCKEKGGILYLVCHSWLLHRNLRNILLPTSNILDFMNDFDIISSFDQETFRDAWRVFGRYHDLPLEQWPKDTSLRKVIAEHLLSGGKLGEGFGIIIFDGKQILN